MSRREIQSQPIAPPATIVCLDCKEEVAYDLTHCPNCGRTLKVAKQRVMLALLMAQIPPLPIKSEVGVRRLLVALFGSDGFEHRFKGKPLPSFVAVAALLNGLYARDAEIVKRRYGLDDGEVWTLIDLGQEFQISRGRVDQLVRRSLRTLRHPSRTARLFIDK